MSIPSESDHTPLIEQIRLGDSAAMAEYVELKRAQLLAFIQSRIGGPLRKKIEPEDILQEASLEAVKSLEKIDLNQRDPINWVFQICERKIIDAHRRHFASQKRDASREAALPEGSQGGGIANLLIASMTTPSEAFSRDQRQLRMLAALDTLPEEQREALRLRYLVGMPSKEIAAKLGKTDGAMRVMLSRSLAKLQDMLVD